jgi:hypothetical protein
MAHFSDLNCQFSKAHTRHWGVLTWVQVRCRTSSAQVAIDLVLPVFQLRCMAKRAAFFPAWAQTLGAMLDEGAKVRAWCSACGRCTDVDIAALTAIKGRDYGLIDRRSRCKMTGCKGWVRFHYSHGVFRPLWSDAATLRWTVK